MLKKRKRRTDYNNKSDIPSTRKKRAIKKKSVKVPRTRNMGTMTESEYFNKIRSAFRNAFRFWKPMKKVLDDASRPSQNNNKRIKIEYQCNKCKEWFTRKEVEVDHIEECGSLKCYDDIVPFLIKLTTEDLNAYQILCKICHKEKTKEYHDMKKEIKLELTGIKLNSKKQDI